MSFPLPEGLSPPGWLKQIVDDPLLLGDGLAMLTATNFPPHGSGTFQVLECIAACLEAVYREEQLEAAYQWARAARRIVSLASRLPADQTHVHTPTDREYRRPVWGSMLRLADKLRPALELPTGVARVAGHLLLGQLHRTRPGDEGAATFKPMATKTASRLAACAHACLPASKSDTAGDWLSLVQLHEFSTSTLLPIATNSPVGEVRDLAKNLTRALENQSRTELPGSEQPIVVSPGPRPPVAPGKERKKKLPRKERPGAAGMLKAASYATTAEAFAVFRYWHWLAPDELKAVTRDLVASLQIERANDDTADFALLTLVSLVISHDHRCTLKLALQKNDDFWFCPELGCVFVDRGILLGLSGARGSHGHVLVVFPRIIVEAIRSRLKSHPDAKELGELMRRAPDDTWLSAAEHFVRGLGDPYHPPCSARLAHSLGLAYVATGTPRVVAAQQTLNWGMSPDSAPSYYGVPATVANSSAARAFESLGLGSPEELPADMVSGRPDIPGDDEIHAAWGLTGQPVRHAFESLPAATTVAACLELFNAAMVSCWRALHLVDAGRPIRPDSPSVADVLVHPRWCRKDDKETLIDGTRLLLRSAEVTDVVSAAVTLRGLLMTRLRALGVAEDKLPRSITAEIHKASLFVEVAWKSDGSGRLVARAFSDTLLKDHPAPWRGPTNLGRIFWISESVVAPEEWAEQLLSGHGRNLAHTGSVALSVPVMALLEGCAPFVERTLQRLVLPRFAGGLHETAALRAPEPDLRFVDRRAKVASRPRDIPRHHVDGDTLAALVIIDECLAELGRGPQMPPAARVLMSLVCASGLVHSDDVGAAWSAMVSSNGMRDQPWHSWTRHSRQPICMPKQPATWIATDLCGALPALGVAETQLRKWLVERFPTVRWPCKEGATIVALCYLAARWVRLHVPPFLCEAYRPESLSAVLDDLSNRRLCLGDPRRSLGLIEVLRPRQTLRATDLPADATLQQVMTLLRKHTVKHKAIGGPERRARRIGRFLKARFDLEHASPVAAMVITWLLAEAKLWEPRSRGRVVPATWLEYLRRMLPVLARAERAGLDPLRFRPEDWRQLGREILDTSDMTDPHEVSRVRRERHHALARLTLLLARDANYPDARAALETAASPARAARYRPSRASVLVTNFDVETCGWMLQLMREDWPLESLQHEAQLRVAVDTCARADETNALAMTDLGTGFHQAAFRPHNFTHLKREWNHRTNGLRPTTSAVVTAVVQMLKQTSRSQKFLFSQQGPLIDLRLGRSMQARNSSMLRQITGNDALVWHALRGMGLMQKLAPDWELDILNYLQGPLLLSRAQTLMSKLAGDSVSHFAKALGCSGHLSPGVPITSYLTAWPYWYSCAMRVATSKVKVSPELADALPGGSRQLLRTVNCRYGSVGGVDDWAWAVKLLHFPGWRKDRDPLRHLVLPPVVPRPDKRTVAVISKVRYLLLRSLHLSTVLAAQTSRIAHTRALGLERHAVMLRRFEEVHHPADGSEASEVALGSAARLLDRSDGQTLFSTLVHAQAPVRDALKGWLERSGPKVNADRLKTVLGALPADIGLEIDWGAKCDVEDLGESGQRIRAGRLTGHKDDTPRVRLFQPVAHQPLAGKSASRRARINDHRAAMLTALARLTLQIDLQLLQKGSPA